MNIREIKFADYVDQVEDTLIRDHYVEVCKHPDLMKLKLDRARFQLLEDAGMLLVLGAFDADDKLIGYSASWISNHIHYSDLVYCHNDAIYLDPAHRSGTLGVKLIKETERAAKDRGARMCLWHGKPDTALSAIMPRMGYVVNDILFSKEI